MKRTLLLLAAFLVLGAVHAAPVRTPREPFVPSSQQSPQLDLSNTSLRGNCFNLPCTITFAADGTLTYNGGTTGIWRLSGNQLYFEINRYSEHRGPILGNMVQGESSNKAGREADFSSSA